MRCPTLKELPPPPPGKTGWPWTEESPQLPDTMPNGRPWPKVSIVTPNYNYGRFIEEAIRSVLLQGYPNLEYIIIDGGSTDNSLEIIKKYEPWLAYWVSEPDRGQAHAINKGFKKSTGDILAWLNSDDVYAPDAIYKMAKFLAENQNIDIVYGDCLYIDAEGNKLSYYKTTDFEPVRLFIENFIPQSSTLFRRRVIKHSLLNEGLVYCFDYDLWLRQTQRCRFRYFPTLISYYRLHTNSKTVSEYTLMRKEEYETSAKYMKHNKLPRALETGISAIANWKLSIINWILDNKETAKQCFNGIKDKRSVIQEPAFVKEAIFTLTDIKKAREMSPRDIKQKEQTITSFYRDITEKRHPKLLSNLISQYYLSLAAERKDPKLLLKGISENPHYFLELILRRIKSYKGQNSHSFQDFIYEERKIEGSEKRC